MKRQLTALIEREGDGYVSICPELDVASQGDSIEEARSNLIEAVELFFETASEAEIEDRLHEELYVTRLEVSVGLACATERQRSLPDSRTARVCRGEAQG